MSTAKTTTRQLQPATAEELLDHEEALAIQNVADSAQRLGDDLCTVADLRNRIRRQPFLAIGLGGAGLYLGFKPFRLGHPDYAGWATETDGEALALSASVRRSRLV